jgi:hypothetical protein
MPAHQADFLRHMEHVLGGFGLFCCRFKGWYIVGIFDQKQKRRLSMERINAFNFLFLLVPGTRIELVQG